MPESLLPTLIIVVVVLFLLFLLLREFNAWYWKINEIITILKRIEAQLSSRTLLSPSAAPASTPRPETSNQTVEIECPHCHKSEVIQKEHYKNPSQYTLFKASYSSFLGSVSLVCNDCGTKFKIESQML
jgi:DNA-directed RNA polymerase subunit RPC12/RpoP